jgi:two-component SAPR family response regulator
MPKLCKFKIQRVYPERDMIPKEPSLQERNYYLSRKLEKLNKRHVVVIKEEEIKMDSPDPLVDHSA